MTEDETVGWHHWLNGRKFEEASGIGDGQGCLMFWSPWGLKESDMTEWLNWTELIESYKALYIFNIINCKLSQDNHSK